MNINANYNHYNSTLQQSALRANVLKSNNLKTNTLKSNGKTPADLGLNVSNDVQVITTDKTDENTKGNVIVELSNDRLYTYDEMFAITNKESNTIWTIGGEDIKYKDLSEDTKTYLSEFNKVHVESGKNGINFTKALEDLGNAYAKKREELSSQFSGDELNGKLGELENAFKAYTEKAVIGSTPSNGITMKTQAGFEIWNAQSARRMAEMQAAYQKGENLNSVKSRGITSDDKQLHAKFIKNAKSALNNVVDFFNKYGTAGETKNLYNYVGEEGSWSLGKLSTTFDLLENIDNANPNKYSKKEFEEYTNSDEFNNLFSEDEKNVFVEMFNCYK